MKIIRTRRIRSKVYDDILGAGAEAEFAAPYTEAGTYPIPGVAFAEISVGLFEYGVSDPR